MTLTSSNPGSDLLSEFPLKKSDLESLKVGELKSSLLSGSLFRETGVGPFFFEVELVDVVDELGSLLVPLNSWDSKSSQLDPLCWNELPVNSSGWTINKNLI